MDIVHSGMGSLCGIGIQAAISLLTQGVKGLDSLSARDRNILIICMLIEAVIGAYLWKFMVGFFVITAITCTLLYFWADYRKIIGYNPGNDEPKFRFGIRSRWQ